MPGSMTRRTFVRTMAVGAGAASMASAAHGSWKAWRFLTDREAALVDAVAEQIVPADQDPGARDVGVVNFIDQQLAAGYRRHQAAYRVGLQALEATCQAQFGATFLAAA